MGSVTLLLVAPSMIYLHIPDDPSVVAAVGRIALRHGQLDYILRMTIKTLGGLSIQDALDATARLGSRDLRERIRKLARQRLGEGAPLLHLEAILQRAAKATDRRNHLLHTLWAHELDGAPVIRDEDNHTFRTIPTSGELDAVAGTLAKIATELNMARLDGFLSEALKQNKK
jgi:hypothetical protein